MPFSLFLGIAAIFFVIGILFLIKGASSKEQEAVPISNPKEIEALKSAFMPPEKRESSESASNANKETGEVPDSKSKERRSFLKSKKQIEIEQWIEENRRLKKDIAEQKDSFRQLEQNLEVLKKEYHQMKEVESDKTRNLQSKIAKIQMEKEQLSINVRTIEELKANRIKSKQILSSETSLLRYR